MTSVTEAIRAAHAKLAETSDTARLDAELLMAYALGVSRSDMLLGHMHQSVPEGFAALIKRRAAHEPVAYITGLQEFFGRDFAVGPGVLIPRGDSEILIEAALEEAPPLPRVIDLGTGSGALLVTALLELEGASGVGVDASFEAIRFASTNALRHGVLGETVRFVEASWAKPDWALDMGRFDLVLCNPPYVEEGVHLEPDVRDFEPASALFAGAEGLADYRRLIPQLREMMKEDAVAIFEIGHMQADAVTAVAHNSGFEVQLRMDLAGRPRCLVLR
ncbi:MAG: peptide chain release factor N(5)-glutamine methyltransferase [Pseudomonadota bacterium]